MLPLVSGDIRKDRIDIRETDLVIKVLLMGEPVILAEVSDRDSSCLSFHGEVRNSNPYPLTGHWHAARMGQSYLIL